MKYTIPFFAFLLLSACSDPSSMSDSDSAANDSAGTSTFAEAGAIGGIYSFGSNPDVEAVGSVTVYPESDTTLLFFLDFTRGAPSYNMGVIAARARLRDGVWTYMKSEPDELEACEIEFMFNEKFVQLITRQTGCSFGANVIVDHVYERKSTLVPEYFIGHEGDTVYFSNLAKAVK